MEEGRSAFKILSGKPTGKIPLGRPRLRWEDNIRTDVKEISINMRNLVDSANNRDYWRALVNVAFVAVSLSAGVTDTLITRRLVSCIDKSTGVRPLSQTRKCKNRQPLTAKTIYLSWTIGPLTP